MEITPPRTEHHATAEREHASPSHELARRLLVGATRRDAFNPHIPLSEVTKETLGTFASRDYSVFNAKSHEERRNHGGQMETWLTTTQTLFTNSKEFFTANEKGKQWAEVYKRLGLSVENVDKDALQQFYAKYLGATDEKDGGVKQFVKDVLNAPEYKTSSGTLDMAKLQHDLSAISWIAHVFGENSAQVISRLTAAEGMLETNPDELIKNTTTTLPTHEKKLLEFLHKEKTTKPETPPIKPPEPKTPETHAETTKAEEAYKKYFGEDWKEKLKKNLLIDVKQATEEDREREKKNGVIGHVATNAEVGPHNKLVANHIIVYNESAVDDFAFRTEIGEAMWNILENIAVTKKVPPAETFQARAKRRTPELVVQSSTQLLDMWDGAYKTQPTRYSGLTGKPREYKNIPEWKSEGFADGIAIEIKRKAGLPLDAKEQEIWNSLTPPCKELLDAAAVFLPEVSITTPPEKPETKPHTDTPKIAETPSHAEDGNHGPTTHEVDPSKDLVKQVNEVLRHETESTSRFEATPATLKKYLQSLSIQGFKLNESDAAIKKINGENMLQIYGKIKVPFGSVTFSATLANDPAGGIRLKTHTLQLEGIANMKKKEIEDNITNLDVIMEKQINAQIDQSWEVSNMKIGEDALEMEFKKK